MVAAVALSALVGIVALTLLQFCRGLQRAAAMPDDPEFDEAGLVVGDPTAPVLPID